MFMVLPALRSELVWYRSGCSSIGHDTGSTLSGGESSWLASLRWPSVSVHVRNACETNTDIMSSFLAAGMHWTAAAGTFYELRGYHDNSSTGQQKNVNLIIALCLVS